MNHDMRFPTMWYVRQAKAQTIMCIGTVLSEPFRVKMPHCWKSHVAAHILKTEEMTGDT